MKIILKNKRGLYNYEIIKTYEAGLVLLGSEVKSIRASKVAFNQSSYVDFKDGEAFITGIEIEKYDGANILNHDPKRVKKLLLNKGEIKKIQEAIALKGLTVVPKALYFNDRSLIKIEIALVRGLKKYDKREKEKEKDFKKDTKKYV